MRTSTKKIIFQCENIEKDEMISYHENGNLKPEQRVNCTPEQTHLWNIFTAANIYFGNSLKYSILYSFVIQSFSLGWINLWNNDGILYGVSSDDSAYGEFISEIYILCSFVIQWRCTWFDKVWSRVMGSTHSGIKFAQ